MRSSNTFGAGLALMLIVSGCSGEQANKGQTSPLKQQLTERLRASGCAACHSVDSKGVGPSMTAVAERYGSSASDQVTASLRSGSQKRWGIGRMQAQPHLAQAEVDAIASMVGQLTLSGRPTPGTSAAK